MTARSTPAASDIARRMGTLAAEIERLRAFDERVHRLLGRQQVARGDEPFVNPRNAAAGALRQIHDVDVRRLRALEFRAY